MRRPYDRTLTVSALSRRRGCSRPVSISKTVGEEAAAEVGVLSACVCGASPGAPPAHAGAPQAAPGVADGLQLDRPPGLGLLAGPAAKRVGEDEGAGSDGEEPARDKRPRVLCDSPVAPSPGACCGCVRARARVLALSLLPSFVYVLHWRIRQLRRFSDRIRGDRRQTFPPPLSPFELNASLGRNVLWIPLGSFKNGAGCQRLI